MDNLLKGNYETDKKVLNKDNKEKKDDFKTRALASIGGSMVFVEKEILTWDGNNTKQKVKKNK